MKIYKKIMDILAMVEKLVLAVSTVLILVLTVGNVFSRKVIPLLSPGTACFFSISRLEGTAKVESTALIDKANLNASR